MPFTTSQDVADWVQRRGGLTHGLPRLRARVKARALSAIEIVMVKEYLANLDTSRFSNHEKDSREAGKTALAEALEAPPTAKPGNTVLVTAIAVMAALATAVIVRG